MDYKQIGKRIKEARKNKGFTQEYLAERLDIDPSFLSRIENGHNKAGLETYIKICQLLDVSLDFLTMDVLPSAHKNIIENEFRGYTQDFDSNQIKYIMDNIKLFAEYIKNK